MSYMIKGIASWAFIQHPNTKWDDTHRYEISLDVPKEAFDDYTSRVKFGAKYKEGKYIININLPLKDKVLESVKPPVCVDADAQPFTNLIGNGSEVLVKYRTFEYTKGQHKGKTRAYLEGVQIVTLVPYEAPTGDDEDGKGGDVSFEPLKTSSPHK